MRVSTRPSTPEDIEAVAGGKPLTTVRAWTLLIEDQPVGVAGWFMYGGVAHVFSDLRPGVPKLTAWRAARQFMALVPPSALCVTRGAGPFLERLGWRYCGQHGDDEVYGWHS